MSLFTGVAGIEAGLGHVFHPILMCDKDEACVEVLKKLQVQGYIPACTILTDIADVTEEHMQHAEALTAGFPCPDIAGPGPVVASKGRAHHCSSTLSRLLPWRRCCKSLYLRT